jgi:hypothetical protein
MFQILYESVCLTAMLLEVSKSHQATNLTRYSLYPPIQGPFALDSKTKEKK